MGECIIARRGGGSRRVVSAYLGANAAGAISANQSVITCYSGTNGEVKLGDLPIDSKTIMTIEPNGSVYVMDKSGRFELKDGEALIINGSGPDSYDGSGFTTGILKITRRGAAIYAESTKYTGHYGPTAAFINCTYTLKQEYCSC